MHEFTPGQIIDDRFKLLKLVGSGGMGFVYKAEQLGLDRIVAIKFIKRNPRVDVEYLARFKQEAEILASLSHPHTCQFLGYGIADSPDGVGRVPYIAMEYLEGRTLGELLSRQRPLPVKRALRIAAQIADGLAHAHKRHVVHRDLKPANIFIIDDRGRDCVKIADFGLAKLTEMEGSRPTKITKEGVAIGTPLYMSPEQVTGSAVTLQSDIYSLGCLLCECIYGKPPFFDKDEALIMLMHYQADLKLPAADDSALAASGVIALLQKALEKEPQRRFEDMVAFRDAMTRCLQDNYDESFSVTLTPADALPVVVVKKPKPEEPAPEQGPQQVPAPVQSRLLIPGMLAIVLLLAAIAYFFIK